MEETTKEETPAAAPDVVGEVLIEVRDLVKHYGPIKAVDGITFEARSGDILGFMGPNGAGKTTAMRLITGFLAPDSGGVRVSGHDMASDSLAGRQKLGYLPENAPAYGEMTTHGFLEFIAEARGLTDIHAIDRVVEMAELRKVEHQTIETLSKGYKRRVGLAQALIHDPEVLILDEPTDGLDPNQKAVVQDLISNLSAERCIVLSTHILDEVERVCNRAMIISQGKILVDSTPRELVEQAPDHNLISLTLDLPSSKESESLVEDLRQAEWCDRVEILDGSSAHGVEIKIYPAAGQNRLPEVLEAARGVPISAVHQQEGRLDDLFREITRGVSR
ncbi:MAG: ATP-binding cassette domain-containing protein [Acidobacteriota bacterium]